MRDAGHRSGRLSAARNRYYVLESSGVMARAHGVPLWRVVGFYSLVPGLLVLDWALFRYLLGTDYVVWYLANGALIAVGAAFVSRIWESVEGLGRPLISADPVAYYGACLQVVGVTVLMAANAGRPPASERPSVRTERFRLDAVVGPLDYLLNALLMLVVLVLVVGWLLFVAPANYLVTLVAGAPAREHVRHPERRMIGVVGRRLPGREAVGSARVGRFRSLYLYETGVEGSPTLTPDEEAILERERENDGDSVVDLTFGRNPFATTQTLTGLVVFVLARVV
jgi:hypothetical protein